MCIPFLGGIRMHIRKKTVLYVIFSILLFISVGILSGFLEHSLDIRNLPDLSSEEGQQKFRRFDISAEYLAEQDSYGQLAEDFLYHKGSLNRESGHCPWLSWFHILIKTEQTEPYRKAFETVLADVQCFPVQPDTTGGEALSFEDSWGGARSYGGERHHEGTDIMPSRKERGYFAVVSTSDGIVEKKGWLKLGGYRLGIRAPHGSYFYYAHLDHYAEGIEEGTEVKAGQVIGYMGDTGYGEEGTRGKFAVHLHFGIYMILQGKEVSVNPYQILRYLEHPRNALAAD